MKSLEKILIGVAIVILSAAVLTSAGAIVSVSVQKNDLSWIKEGLFDLHRKVDILIEKGVE